MSSVLQAAKLSDQAIGHYPAAPSGYVIGKSMIQVADNPDQPSPVRDVLVWRIGYSDTNSPGLTEIAIDYKAGEIVRQAVW